VSKIEIEQELLQVHRRTSALNELGRVIDYLIANEIIRNNLGNTNYVGVNVFTGNALDLDGLTEVGELKPLPSQEEIMGLADKALDEVAKVNRANRYENADLVIAMMKLYESLEKLFGVKRKAQEDCGCHSCKTFEDEKCSACLEACLPCQDKHAEEE